MPPSAGRVVEPFTIAEAPAHDLSQQRQQSPEPTKGPGRTRSGAGKWE
jgi:hypothetical protein